MKSAKIVSLEKVEGKHPLDGGGGTWHRLIQAEDTEAGMLFGFGLLKPGEGRGWHEHTPGEDEIFFVIEGEGLAEWEEGGQVHNQKIGSGSALYTPGKMRNNITNIGTSDLKCVFCIYKP